MDSQVRKSRAVAIAGRDRYAERELWLPPRDESYRRYHLYAVAGSLADAPGLAAIAARPGYHPRDRAQPRAVYARDWNPCRGALGHSTSRRDAKRVEPAERHRDRSFAGRSDIP